MLISGRWIVLLCLVSGLLVGEMAYALPTQPQADLNRDAAIAAEQQKVFGLSASPRLLPDNNWFIENDNGRNQGLTDPMQGRWAKDPYALPGRKVKGQPQRR